MFELVKTSSHCCVTICMYQISRYFGVNFESHIKCLLYTAENVISNEGFYSEVDLRSTLYIILDNLHVAYQQILSFCIMTVVCSCITLSLIRKSVARNFSRRVN